MSRSAFDLVVFDCDGVLVDSEIIACRVETELLNAAGFPITFEEVRRDFVGRSRDSVRRHVEERFGRPPPADLSERSLATVLAAFERELAPIAGVAEAVAALAAPRCVASSSDPARIRRALGLTGLLDLFDPHLFSATMVARGKPAPDLFLHAAERMGAAPARAIVIEDSVPGVEAARAAGMTVLGFHGGAHCTDGHAEQLRAAGAHGVFGAMDALAEAIEAAALRR